MVNEGRSRTCEFGPIKQWYFYPRGAIFWDETKAAGCQEIIPLDLLLNGPVVVENEHADRRTSIAGPQDVFHLHVCKYAKMHEIGNCFPKNDKK